MSVLNQRCLLALCMILLVSGCATNRMNEQFEESDRANDVRATLQAYVAGRQARDIDAVVAVLDKDVDQLTSRGEWRRGVDAATEGMKRSSKQNPGERTLYVETIRFLAPDIALADARYVIKGTNGPDRILWSSFTLKMHSDGSWVITSIRNQMPAA